MSTPRTLFEKIWDRHVVVQEPQAPAVLYIDRHFLHEVTSPQAFEGLRSRGLKVRRPDKSMGTTDHSTPTTGLSMTLVDELAQRQVSQMQQNCREFGVPLYDLDNPQHGIVHVIGPELGLTQPGMTIVCGDSHTATHGAFGALAFGIGTSEVEHVLATQCLLQQRPKTCLVTFEGRLAGRRHRQGYDPGLDRRYRHGRRHRLRLRICRRGCAGDEHGRAHDAVQYVDRSRRTRRHGRSGRNDLSNTWRAGSSHPKALPGNLRWPTGAVCLPIPARPMTAA